jgi:hypothetical protein
MNIVKDEKGDLLADFHSIMNTWRDHFYQLLNVYGVSDVTQTEINATEPLVPQPSPFKLRNGYRKAKKMQIARY